MYASEPALTQPSASMAPKLLLLWYTSFFLFMAIAPLDRQVWLGASLLPVLFVTTLVLTYRAFPLSSLSYLAISVWLTLHTVAAHYTYPKVPVGFWLEHWLSFQRNHFDRIVHFGFGFLMTYPLEEIFRRLGNLKGRLLSYVVVVTVLGFSAVWEIFEAWIGQVAHPDLEMAFVGHQGDVWDPQRDMAAALYGSLLCVAMLWLARKIRDSSSAVTSSVPPDATALPS